MAQRTRDPRMSVKHEYMYNSFGLLTMQWEKTAGLGGVESVDSIHVTQCIWIEIVETYTSWVVCTETGAVSADATSRFSSRTVNGKSLRIYWTETLRIPELVIYGAKVEVIIFTTVTLRTNGVKENDSNE